MKLGEILIKMNVIDEDQLQEALDSQLIYGGHLGTCLIEQGTITEDQLGQVLAQTFGVSCATTEMFENIPKYVIESLPRTMVEKHSAVPFRLDGNDLYIAMMTPTDLQTVDELSFACGRKVVPWIAPEVRLLQAMDRYYDVARRMRYITLARQLDDAAGTKRKVDPNVAPKPKPRAARPAAPAAAPASAGTTATATLPRPKTRPAASAQKTAVAKTAAAIVDRKKAAVASRTAQSLARGITSTDPLEPLATLLCRVAGEAMLGKILVEHAVPNASRSVLFTVQAGNAVPWSWRGVELSTNAAGARFPISGEPLFSLLLGEGSYRGPVPEDDRYHGFYDTLGIDPPNEMVLVPSYADDRLVAMLYFDDGDGLGIEEETSTFCRIARKVGLALNLIHIKQQIRTV